MPRYSRSQLRSKIRQIQRDLQNPKMNLKCGCGYRTTRRLRNLPKRCPSCGCIFVYRS